ncbi:peptidoglycan editing factor PgeF [Noviherbaspirillum sp.]|uniref:peptidoglycan editing factor PgeF n=1 Tax=Noviherbaspirillum sp. TaxID=1926288 RepID=UPI002FE23433
MTHLIFPDWDVPLPHAGALSTTRHGGVSLPPYDDGAGGGGLNLGVHVGDRPEHVRRNRELLRTMLPAEPAWLTQVHGTTVVDAAIATDVPQADASVASRPGVVCAIQTADCLPVLFCALNGRAVGAAHAGWRGLAGGVLQNTVDRMRAMGADEIVAWLGPAIGPDCFEVGTDVLDAFVSKDVAVRTAFVPVAGSPGKYLADIYALARRALGNAGIDRVTGGGSCTVTGHGNFFSFRRDRTTGRMASLIWLK